MRFGAKISAVPHRACGTLDRCQRRASRVSHPTAPPSLARGQRLAATMRLCLLLLALLLVGAHGAILYPAAPLLR